MKQWAELEAGKILDAFAAYDGPDDLLRLQGAIARALCHFYEMGRDQSRSTTMEFHLIDEAK